MAKEKLLKLQGQVIEALANGQFTVEVEQEGKKYALRCYLNGKMRQNQIKVIIGDKVDLELPPSSHMQNAIGRITYRIK